MSQKQYLTVKEFSKLAGISRQAVYSQLSTRLANFTCQIDNKTMIDISALELFYSSQVSSQFSSQGDKSDKNDKSAVSNQDKQGQADISKELIEMLKEEIKKKDQRIEKLQDSLDRAYAQIATLAQQASYITAADKTEKIMQQSKEEVIEASAAAANQNTEKMNDTEKKFKKRWFQFWK